MRDRATDVAGDVDLLSVAHGDFRCDNLIYDDDGSVRAILDWELATLGHPLADVAYLCMPYEIPPFVAGPLSGFRGLNLDKHGVPPLEDLVDAYAEKPRSKERGSDVAALCRAGLPRFDYSRAWATSASASICRGVFPAREDGDGVEANAARRRRARRHARRERAPRGRPRGRPARAGRRSARVLRIELRRSRCWLPSAATAWWGSLLVDLSLVATADDPSAQVSPQCAQVIPPAARR